MEGRRRRKPPFPGRRATRPRLRLYKPPASILPLNLDVSLAVFSSKFKLSYDKEPEIMRLDPDAEDFPKRLEKIFGSEFDDSTVATYRQDILLARNAGIPLGKRTITADDFLPEKKWRVMAISGYMLDDPYSGSPGVRQMGEDTYEVTVRLTTEEGDKRVTFELRLLETLRGEPTRVQSASQPFHEG